MIVAELLPGMSLRLPLPLQVRHHGQEVENEPEAIFVAQTLHPYYIGLQLVIWRIWDGEKWTWSHDALNIGQYIGEATQESWDPAHRLAQLKRVFRP